MARRNNENYSTQLTPGVDAVAFSAERRSAASFIGLNEGINVGEVEEAVGVDI